MIIVGFVLAVLGYWLLPDLVPEIPLRLDNLVGVVGVILIIIGLVLLGPQLGWPPRRWPQVLVLAAAMNGPLVGLRLTITRELATLRMWRQMGDTEGEERCNAHLNDMLDRLRRYDHQDRKIRPELVE